MACFRREIGHTISPILAPYWEDKLGSPTSIEGEHLASGDGGFVAKCSDGTATNSSWKAQSFYIAPLQHPDDVVVYGNIHDTSHLAGGSTRCEATDLYRGLLPIHYPIPDGWTNPNFDDFNWPQAFEYLDQEVGIMGMPGYWRYPDAFIGGRWIWTVNLVFDNTVLLRKTVR